VSEGGLYMMHKDLSALVCLLRLLWCQAYWEQPSQAPAICWL